jgi:uncharacterized protein YeaO (DUF488 family)
MGLRTKSVQEPREKTDGLRILATRYRGRFLKKSLYDVWMANLGPNERLLKQADSMPWGECRKRYRAEIRGLGGPEKANPLIRNTGQKFTLRLIERIAKTQNVTLMCHCPDNAEECPRHVLRQIIQSNTV